MTTLTIWKIRGEPLVYWRNNTGAGHVNGRWLTWGLKGSPDVLVCWGGRFIGIECKSAKGKQSPEQKRFQEKFEAVGGIYILARSYADVDALFKHSSLQLNGD